MSARDVRITLGGAAARLQLADFNRLRWTLHALNLNPHLLAGSASPRVVQVVDSLRLISDPGRVPPAEGSNVILWDGLNAYDELQAQRPDIIGRDDLCFLHVGTFAEAAGGFAKRSAPLFPARLPSGMLARRVRVPMWVRAEEALRWCLRPLKNVQQARADHQRLQRGGCLVFCGLVRPSAAVLDGFLRDTTLAGLRHGLDGLVGLDWRGPCAEVQATLQHAYGLARAQTVTLPCDFAALYSVVNVLHRMGTLAHLHTMRPALYVNEFGVQRHFDPYDTQAYGGNLFIDFGSSRGPDLVYPRTIDLWCNVKRAHCLRFLAPGEPLAGFLQATDAAAFTALCNVHAHELFRALQTLPFMQRGH